MHQNRNGHRNGNALVAKAERAAVTLEGVGKVYGEVVALAPTTLSIAQGESVALLGPSGSGKTTLLSLLAGALRPTFGRVCLSGIDLTDLPQGSRLAGMAGMLPQQFDLVPQLSALNNTLAGRLGQWSVLKSMVSLVWPQDRGLALAALDRVGVANRAAMRASKLSGGEQQRVAIARLLVQDPAIFLADEPVSSLDPSRAEVIIHLFIGLVEARGKTLVASLHSIDLARKNFRRLVGLRNGSVIFDLPAARVTEGMLAELYDLQGLRVE